MSAVELPTYVAADSSLQYNLDQTVERERFKGDGFSELYKKRRCKDRIANTHGIKESMVSSGNLKKNTFKVYHHHFDPFIAPKVDPAVVKKADQPPSIETTGKKQSKKSGGKQAAKPNVEQIAVAGTSASKKAAPVVKKPEYKVNPLANIYGSFIADNSSIISEDLKDGDSSCLSFIENNQDKQKKNYAPPKESPKEEKENLLAIVPDIID